MDDTLQFLKLLWGGAHEIRIVPSGGSCVFNAPEDAYRFVVEQAPRMEARGDTGIFVSLNPIPANGKRAANENILMRNWMFIDIDEFHEDEHTNKHLIIAGILDYLESYGLCQAIVSDSGWGAHILYRIELANNAESYNLIKSILNNLYLIFKDKCKIDRSVCDAARMIRIPGTPNRKRAAEGGDVEVRTARLIYVSSPPIDVVPADVLQRLAGLPSEFAIATKDSAQAYLEAAVKSECEIIAKTHEGGRNIQLNKSAYALGGLAHLCENSIEYISARLYDAGIASGLGKVETIKTICSGLRAGMLQPRRITAEDLRGSAARQDNDILVTVELSRIQESEIKWLWDKRLAKGFVTLFAGKTGVGKSLVSIDLIARLSTGRRMPEAANTNVGSTLLVTEDPVAHVVVPRLKAAGADLSSVRTLRFEKLMTYTLDDIDTLNKATHEFDGGLSLIVVDPPANFIDDAIENKNASLRRTLAPLVHWAASHEVAIIMITHMNKQRDEAPLDSLARVIGSVAWGSIARVVLVFGKSITQTDTYVCGCAKSNISTQAETIEYSFESANNSAPRIIWKGTTLANIDAVGHAIPPNIAVAVQWLLETLRDGGRDASEIKKLCRDNGISRRAIDGASSVLNIQKKFVNIDGKRKWEWRLPTK